MDSGLILQDKLVVYLLVFRNQNKKEVREQVVEIDSGLKNSRLKEYKTLT